MLYRVENELFVKYPDLRIGLVVGKGLTIERSHPEMTAVIAENRSAFLRRLEGSDLSELPNIIAWRETYRSFATNPKKHSPTAEALAKRVAKGHSFPNINTAVDAYLAVELLYLLPIGGYDIDLVNGDIILRKSTGGEIFHPLGGGEPEHTYDGELVYADSSCILTRMWNHKDAEHTKIAEHTKDIILASEAPLKTIDDSDLKGTIDRIVEYEHKFCGGSYTTYWLNAMNSEVEL